MMRRRAGFQPDEARRNPCKESENLASSQLLAHDYAARLINRMHLENVLCQIKTDCCNIAHGWLPLLVIFDDHHYGTRCRESGPSTPSVGGLFTRLSNTANTGRRPPFPPRRTQRASPLTGLAANAFSSSEPSKAAAFV
jgi:hypothetical protein